MQWLTIDKKKYYYISLGKGKGLFLTKSEYTTAQKRYKKVVYKKP